MLIEIIILIILVLEFIAVLSINSKADSLARSLKKINERLDNLESKLKLRK
jgi:hypothetical protein